MSPASHAPLAPGSTDWRLDCNAVRDIEIRDAVTAAQVHMVYDRLRLSVLMTLGVSLAFSALLLPFFPPRLMLNWLAVGATVQFGRYLLWTAYTKVRPDAAALKRWDLWFLFGAALAGLGWSFGPLTMMPRGAHAEPMLLMGIVLCVAAVSAISLAARLSALGVFLGTLMLPSAYALYRTGGDAETYAALIVLAGFFSVLMVGRVLNASIKATIENEIKLSGSLEQIDQERERAIAASLAKTRFLANMSHELRTPLNAVIGAAQLLKIGKGDAASQAQMLDAIQASGSNLLGLIENILDISRIEAGELRLARSDFNLMECIESALATTSLSAQAKGLTLTRSVEPDIQLQGWRHGDSHRIRQVLLNLLGNAVKFTPSGNIELRVQHGQNEPDLHISVSDTGIGIDTASQAYIFEPFRQAEDAANRRFGGSGLGLSIVQQLVHAMDGRITVRSELGQGTRFDIELPLPLAKTATVVPATEPPEHSVEQVRAQLHVLVVEDDPVNQAIVCRLLNHGGYESTAADNGAQALALMNDRHFDLVLMDCQMPDMDGLEATQRMRAGESGPRGRTVPIVALTANAFAEDRAACLDVGMNDFLSKPVLADHLMGVIRKWTQRIDERTAA